METLLIAFLAGFVYSSPGPIAATPTPAVAPCPSAELRSLEVLPGEWITEESPVPAKGPVTGTSRVESILDGCGILEHRLVNRNGKKLFEARVLWGYDVTARRMLLFYIDDGSHTQLYEGRRENDHWSYYRERPGEGGQTILIRVTYAKRGPGFVQIVERSKDKGQTWEPGGLSTYRPAR